VLEADGHGLQHLVVVDAGRPVVAVLPVRGRLVVTDRIDGATVGEREHPALGGAACRVEPRRGLPDLEEHLLGDLLGPGGVADDATGHAEHGRTEDVVECRERGLVASSDTDEQVVGVDRLSGLRNRGQAIGC
jgi:hypothetical protein